MTDDRAPIRLPQDHPPVEAGRIGVLLINLGTPDSTDPKAIRRYLREFLSDPRVIELSPLVWQPILRGIILNTRPKKTAEAYAKIWLAEGNESPLRRYTRRQAEALQATLDPTGERVMVDWAMRYGLPPIAERLVALKDAGCERILVFPLYPQYSATTTATVVDRVTDTMRRMRWQPAIRTVPPFHDDPAYVEAVARSIEDHLGTLDWEPEVILASFHGLPKKYFDAGDPYHCHCMKTARLVRERLGLPKERFRATFQSRFGPQEWLRPYTDETVEALARDEGVKRMAVVTPGFVADCVETLEEIAIGVRETFEENGGTHFTAIPCLNDSPDGNAMIRTVTARELGGWWPAEAEARARKAAE
jgi:ferrochelatase